MMGSAAPDPAAPTPPMSVDAVMLVMLFLLLTFLIVVELLLLTYDMEVSKGSLEEAELGLDDRRKPQSTGWGSMLFLIIWSVGSSHDVLLGAAWFTK